MLQAPGKNKLADRILEIGGYAAGYAGRLFAHAGADVVRVQGQNPPAWASAQAMQIYLHADKRQVTIADANILKSLAEAADVVICHLETADEVMQLGIQEWRCPVKVVLTPFGLTGPKRNWQATPSTLLAMGGYTAVIGDADKAPLSLPGHYVEFQAGALAYTAASAALFTGKGLAGKGLAAKGQNTQEANQENTEVVDISLFETIMSCSQFSTTLWHCAGEMRSRHGSDFWFVEPSELYPCADGWVYVNIVPQFWDPFCVFLGLPELSVDERFSDNDKRRANRVALHAIVAKQLKDQTKAELDQKVAECRVPVGVVKTLQEVLDDSHLRERQHFYHVAHSEQEVKVPGTSFRINQQAHPDRNHMTSVDSVEWQNHG